MDPGLADPIDALLARAQSGTERPMATALIVESECIGCSLCIQACPFDAIIGAARRMHTVVESLCTGCELCLAPCPVDCISVVAASFKRKWTRAQADAARRRFDARKRRLEQHRLVRARPADPASGPGGASSDWIASTVARAIARARRRRSGVIGNSK
jgi:electron transport complex protein RnfB